jgi:hypothetical protein
MSIVKVEQLKAWLRITHNSDDALLQDCIDGAEDEALVFMDRVDLPRRGQMAVDECDSNTTRPYDSNDFTSQGHYRPSEALSDSDDIAPSVRIAIYLLAQGSYEGKDASEMQAVRDAAETKLFPFRNRLGV